MLKALEIHGFKSFADKTRFEFPAGITVVVGPNGSGKSNIVDAIKWVLGEQSAKSLRGKDMADVIFKGSGGVAGGRKATNSAQATLVIENDRRIIDFDADEIHVTRRVYRSGEGEYLINGEACRLKDIKDLFRGTGVGTDAYSLIEQGKVDKLLQASAKERRAIFEEAAGISRFKAKKIDAQRRLARVEQNLLRLSDIVDEVGNRYRSVKAQASKASRYKEYSERLRQLRTWTGFVEFREASEKLATTDSEKAAIDTKVAEATAAVEKADRDVHDLEAEFSRTSEVSSTNEQKLSACREQIAKLESDAHHQQDRSKEWERISTSLQTQSRENRARLIESRDRLGKLTAEQQTAELAYQDALENSQSLETGIQDATARLESLRKEQRNSQSENVTKNNELQSLSGLIQTDEGELKTISEFLSRRTSQIDQLETDIEKVERELESFRAEEERIAAEAESNDSALAESRRLLEESRQQLKSVTTEISQLNSEQSGLAQRADVIDELEQRLDGVQAGVKQVLAMADDDPHTPFGEVYGLVADLVQVNVQHAPLVDVLLGEASQHIVVSGESLIESIATDQQRLNGRVGFISLESLRSGSFISRTDLHGEPGVIGRADKLVRCDEKFRSLIEKLLGRTWVVKTIDDVIRFKRTTTNAFRFATLDGDIFDVDGTAIVGPRSSSLGLVSRRSELRSLRVRLGELDELLTAKRELESEASLAVQKYEQESEELFSRQTGLARSLADQRVATQAAVERSEQLHKSLEGVESEQQSAAEKRTSLTETLTRHQSSLTLARQAIETLVSAISDHSTTIDKLESDVEQQNASLNQRKVDIAKSEQQLTRLEETIRESRESLEDRETKREQLDAEIQQGEQRYLESQRAILDTNSQLAELYIRKDEFTLAWQTIAEQRSVMTRDLQTARQNLRTHQQQIKSLETEKHNIDLNASQMVHHRDAMLQRMLDDYGIDIAKLTEAPAIELDEDSDRESLEDEINQLRRKINNIGAVNTDALVELEDLEGRYTSLDNQYQDLVNAKETLDKIIVRINADSRKLFAETLEAIRQNFQVLYRRTFGGGNADIVLEEGVDILDAGIEIIATPPGKPEFNNSLLSGGEKALTAVSLLLAIFQFRPSPFCVLDEVDAPFDEANIGRFVDVLRSFLGWTKFVIVSHSKKTMTAANTLHGVTMEESGVSTRVSVRFEDVTEDGHIRPQAKNTTNDDKGAA